MANIRQYADSMPDVGIPNPPVQQFAADTSEAVRIQGADTADRLETQADVQLVQAGIQAGTMAYQGIERMQDIRAVEQLLSGDIEIGEDVLNLQRIAEARQAGAISADQARATSSATLRQAIARNPRRGDALKSAYNEFFSDTGAGAGAFQMTAQEKMEEYMVKQAWQQFGIDPALREHDPAAWQMQFQQAQILQQNNLAAKAHIEAIELGQDFTRLQQEQAFPNVVNSILTDAENPAYLPGLINETLGSFVTPSGEFDSSKSVAAQQSLNSLRVATRSQLRQQFPDMGNEDFNNLYSPIDTLFDTALSIADGSMSADAMDREVRIITQAGVLSMVNGNPEAARRFIGLNSLVQDLQVVPVAIATEQNRLANLLLSGADAIVDAESTATVTPFTNTRTERDREVISASVGAYANSAAVAAQNKNIDPPTRQRVADAAVYGARAIGDRPHDVSAADYINYFKSISKPEVWDNLSDTERAAVIEGTQDGVSVFLNDTLAEWSREGSDRYNVVFDQDTNRIRAIPNDRSNPADLRAADKANRKMAESNYVFSFMEVALGKESIEVLGESDLGRALLENSGITSVQEVEWQQEGLSLRSILPGMLDPQRARFAASEIVAGRPRESLVNRLLGYHEQFDLTRTDDEVIRQALEILLDPEEPVAVEEEQPSVGESSGDVLEDIVPVALDLESDETQEDIVRSLLDNLAEAEGGFQNNPRDRGNFVGDNNIGTNRGITPATLAAWRGVDATTITEEDMRNLTAEEANDIYLSEYYERPRINEINQDVQELVFNMAVMSGPRRAIRILQEAAGTSTDGIIGPQTIAASNTVTRREIADLYLEFLRNLENYDTFGAGWEARIERIVARGDD